MEQYFRFCAEKNLKTTYNKMVLTRAMKEKAKKRYVAADPSPGSRSQTGSRSFIRLKAKKPPTKPKLPKRPPTKIVVFPTTGHEVEFPEYQLVDKTEAEVKKSMKGMPKQLQQQALMKYRMARM